MLNVDLVVGVIMTDAATLAPPAHGLDLPRLPSADYRLYPVVDQIADKLLIALTQEAQARDLPVPEEFSIPHDWGARYAKDARHVPACTKYNTVNEALELMRAFIDPVLSNDISGKIWNHEHLRWM